MKYLVTFGFFQLNRQNIIASVKHLRELMLHPITKETLTITTAKRICDNVRAAGEWGVLMSPEQFACFSYNRTKLMDCGESFLTMQRVEVMDINTDYEDISS